MGVLIKGAGDSASGITLRLRRCGFDLVMTDIAVLATVRRTMALSPAVYEETAVVENITGVLRQNQEETQEAVGTGRIVVVVDDRGDIRSTWKPEVIVDAIIAKEDLGTTVGGVQTMIDVGLGLMAGANCHCVVETKRGHNLGRCIWDGSVVPNIRMPGMIGGYNGERTIQASADETFTGCTSIGDPVEKGQLVDKTGGTPIYAEVGGVVRGLLQDGATACKGMKSGDVDLRGAVESCFTVSDKASATGGDTLEAILSRTRLIWRIQRREK